MRKKIEVVDGKITCKKCNEVKDIIYFYQNPKTKLYIGSCKMCKYGAKTSLFDKQSGILDLITKGLKYCSICDTTKSLQDFAKGSSRYGYAVHCKDCTNAKNRNHHKRYHLKVTYGLTLQEHKLMLEKQANKCFICSIDFSTISPKNIHVDHCHKSNKIRGLLCNHCNKGLSGFNDNIQSLENAITYLKQYSND